MSQSSECCCSDTPYTPKSRPGAAAVEFRNIFCNIQIVAGGVNPVALNVAADASPKIPVSGLAPAEPCLPSLHIVTTQQFPAHANDIAPPGDHAFIRNCALLI